MVPYYEQAIANGLEVESYIGLGSTYRCIGEYDKAIVTLETVVKLEHVKEHEGVILFYKDHLNDTFK